MAYARWSLTRHEGEVRVSLHARETLSDLDVRELWRDVQTRLGPEVMTVVFSGESAWIVVHRHARGADAGWHVRSAVG